MEASLWTPQIYPILKTKYKTRRKSSNLLSCHKGEVAWSGIMIEEPLSHYIDVYLFMYV